MPSTRALEAVRRWGMVVVALALVATIALLLWSGVGTVAVVAAGLVVLGVAVVLSVEILSTHRLLGKATPPLWHPDDFAVHVDRMSGRVVRIEGDRPFLVAAGAPAHGMPVDELLMAPRFASIRERRPPSRSGRDSAFRATWRAADGSTRRSETMLVSDGSCLVLYGRDVTEAHDELDRLARRANTDPLTGLPNRSVLDPSLRSAAARSARSGLRFAVVVIDLDGFKAYNDWHGHLAGDHLLAEVAAALREAARAGDDVVRLGGDEFLLVVRDLESRDAAELVARRILAAVWSVSPTGVTASIGVALARGHAEDPVALVARADEAMYEAKRGGGDAFRVVPH